MTDAPTLPHGILVRLQAAADHLRSRSPRVRVAAAFAAGASSAFAFPPLGAWPIFLVSLPVLLAVLQGCRTIKGAFAVGWAFGFGQFLFGLYWIAWALTVDLASWWWAVPFAAAGLPAALALFPGLLLCLWPRLRLSGVSGPLLLGVLLFAAEWLRGHILTGFPWNLTGYVWTETLPMLQATALVGIYGLTALSLLAFSVTSVLVPGLGRRPGQGRSAAILGTLLWGLLIGLGLWGAVRVGQAPADMVDDVRLRLVQTNISQAEKWRLDLRPQHFQDHIDLSTGPFWSPDGTDDVVRYPTVVLWPETAIAYDPTTGPIAEPLAQLLPPGSTLITGAPRFGHNAAGRIDRLWNSAVAVPTGNPATVLERISVYDKYHLVPFGEYMPLPDWMGLDAIASVGTPFTAGPGPEVMNLPGIPPVLPLICYEVIFPGRVVTEQKNDYNANIRPYEANIRPDWLLNLTNDAWYGYTSGPFQHWAISRVRAVEEGLPMIRVAGTGISGVVDPFGRVIASIGLQERGVVDAELPRPLDQRPAPPWAHKTLPVVFVGFFGLIAVMLRARRFES